MAVIKSVYRSADTFRFPTWDDVVAYPINSVVVKYDSEISGFRLWIAAQDVNPGHPPSIGDSDWNLLTYDSDSTLDLINQVWDDNLDGLTARVQVWFDSEWDSETAMLEARIDSEIQVFKDYFDSELGIFRSEVDSDHNIMNIRINDQDSDIAQFIDWYSRGRIYEGITQIRDIVSQRLQDWAVPAGFDRWKANSVFFDPSYGYVLFVSQTTSSYTYSNGWYRNPYGDHVVVENKDSETITGTFNDPVYVSEVAFRGANSSSFNDYFLSGQIRFTYTDATTATVVHELAVVNNTTEIVFENPNPSKQVTNIKLTAYDPSGAFPGINFFRANSFTQRTRYETENASIAVVSSATDLLLFEPHNDVIFVTKDTNSTWIAVDSEWVVAHPKYKYVTRTIENLIDLFPPATELDGTKALVWGTKYDYYVNDNEWVLDSESIPGYDSDRFLNMDSDLSAMKVIISKLDSDVKSINSVYNATYLHNLEDDHDSDITIITNALNNFYYDYVQLKLEHRTTYNTWISEKTQLLSDYYALINSYTDKLTALQIANDSDRRSINAKIDDAIADESSMLKHDLDSDYADLKLKLLAAFLDISLLRNGPVKDNDSDINDLQGRLNARDSDIDYITDVAMKFRGFIDIRTATPQQKPKIGDTYLVRYSGNANTGWGLVTSEYVNAGSLVIYRDSDWTVVSGGSSSEAINATGFPAGTILSFPSLLSIPSSFRLCNGSYFDPGIYSELFTILGTNRLPDLRGYFLRAWSDSDTVDPSGPRAALNIQQDAFKAHTHTYLDVYPNNPDGVLDGGTDQAVDGNSSTTRTSNSTGGAETRPKNITVYYAIAMYTGAGATSSGDSDIRGKVQNFDSDMNSINIWRQMLDSDHAWLDQYIDSEVAYFKSRISERDSDIAVLDKKVVDLDSDVRVLTLYSQLAQNSASRTIASKGILLANTAELITTQVFGSANYEPYNYPDVKYYYATTGANVAPGKAGRLLNGMYGTPNVSTFVIHTGVGATSVGIQADSEIRYDIRIVSTFRTN